MSSFRDWMYNRTDSSGGLSDDFARGVQQFLDYSFGLNGVSREGVILCPCSRCQNSYYLKHPDVYMHLLRNGFMMNYYIWYNHGEKRSDFVHGYSDDVRESSNASRGIHNEPNSNPLDDMVHDLFLEINLDGHQDDLGEEPNPRAKKFYEMYAKAQQPIWPDNPTTLLEWATKIAGKKTANRDSASSADGTVEVALMSAHPDYIHTLPQDWRSVKKFMLNLGLSFRTYDFCINHCFLYYKDGLHLDKCPTCGESRYEARRGKGKLVPQRKMWFFPLTERLQRLYMSRKTAEHMTWHAKCKRRSDPVIHPAGSEQWAHFDEIFPDFASEIRNVRLGLCTDGFDPHHGTTTSPHSIWPVLITPYNLPPGLCMRPEFIFMTALIQGPEDPSIHIDVMLRPIVDELKDLWHNGAVTYDSFRKQNFTMRASLFCTINDFPGYAMLSGWSTKGKLGCPCCMQNTDAFYLKNTRKVCWFDEHRKFLPPNHPERRNQED